MNEKIISKGLELLETSLTIAQDQAPKLMSEFINYLIFEEVMGLIFKLVAFLIAWNVVKLFSSSIKDNQEEINVIRNEINNLEEKNLKAKEVEYLIERKFGDIRRLKESIDESILYKRIFQTVITLVFMCMSFSSLEKIGKLTLAPKIFMLKEGMTLLHPKTCDTKTESK